MMLKAYKAVAGILVFSVLYLSSRSRRTIYSPNVWTSNREFTSRFRGQEHIVQPVVPVKETEILATNPSVGVARPAATESLEKVGTAHDHSLLNEIDNSAVSDPSSEVDIATIGSSSEGTGAPAAADLSKETNISETIPLTEAELLGVLDASQHCQELFTDKYLNNFLKSQKSYCTNSSRSSVKCYYNTIADDGRIDGMCYATSARFDPSARHFGLDCEEPPLEHHEDMYVGSRLLMDLPGYWYGTGPIAVFDSAVDIGKDIPVQKTHNTTILVKREGAGNLWHCIMELISLSWTLDLLKNATDSITGKLSVDPEDLRNARILILDDHEDGPYFDLWGAFGGQTVERISDLAANVSYDNLVIPLAGGSNPLWQGDWQSKKCGHSAPVERFRQKVLSFYDLKPSLSPKGSLNVLYIERRDTRHLVNSADFLGDLQTRMPDIEVISVDMASIPFREQLEMIAKTDVLLGVHGAGLTHLMFLPTGAAVVEILPHDLPHMGFHNLADLTGHKYFSAHAKKAPARFPDAFELLEGIEMFDDWHDQDLEMDEADFMSLMNLAISSVST